MDQDGMTNLQYHEIDIGIYMWQNGYVFLSIFSKSEIHNVDFLKNSHLKTFVYRLHRTATLATHCNNTLQHTVTVPLCLSVYLPPPFCVSLQSSPQLETLNRHIILSVCHNRNITNNEFVPPDFSKIAYWNHLFHQVLDSDYQQDWKISISFFLKPRGLVGRNLLNSLQ